jgi:hypothetical protein
LKEKELFDYLKEKYFQDLTFSEDQFSRWDCYSKTRKTRIELKCRNRHYSTLLIEKDKYFNLIKYYINNEDTPLYINSTPKGIYAFDLRKITPEWITDSRMPKTTEFEETQTIEKTYALLELKTAKKI